MFVIVAVLCVKCCGCNYDNIVCNVFVIVAMLCVMCCVCDSGNVVCKVLWV